MAADWNELFEKYNTLSAKDQGSLAYAMAGLLMANQPQIQNSRVKAIPSLPVKHKKEDIGRFLQTVYEHEAELRETTEVLKWTSYPFFKILKTVADIPTYRWYFSPAYADAEDMKAEAFRRESVFLDKFFRAFRPDALAKDAAEAALLSGKAFYTYRYSVDRSHNAVNQAFWQRLPQDYCLLIGKNNVSGWTVSFNMFYFLKPGTSYKAFGDLFDPYIDDFEKMFDPASPAPDKRTAYFAKIGKKTKREFYIERLNANGAGAPRVFKQNGRWCYWVSLPVDRVFAFDIDGGTPAVASALSSLALTYGQQSDYEAAQLSLLIAPLIKIFTGEIPYFDNTGTQKQNDYRLSPEAREFFEALFLKMMTDNNTGGTALFSAPLKNIQSHNFAESPNANDISETFNRYGMEKAGLAGLIPVDADVKAGQVAASQKIESRFVAASIYPQIERMMEHILSVLPLNFDWNFTMFGSIFEDDGTRENAEKRLGLGDTAAWFTLCALDGTTWVRKRAMLGAINASGIYEQLQIPPNAYTQAGGETKETGRPAKTADDLLDGNAGESTEDMIDTVGEK